MDLIRDIADIVKDDKHHNVRISIEYVGVTVYISDSRDEEYENKCVIPSRLISSLVILPAMEATPSTSVAARAAMIATTSSAIFTSPRLASFCIV